MPHGEAWTEFVGPRHEVEFGCETTVIAFLGLGKHLQVGLQRLFVGPRRAVDALQHRTGDVAPPVRTGDRLKLERAEATGRRHMRAGAHVAEAIAIAVVADRVTAADLAGVLAAGGTGRDALDDLRLVRLVGEERRRLGCRKLVAFERQVGFDDLLHAGLDLGEVIVGECLALGQFHVVVEAELDRRTDRELRAGVQVEDRLGHHVGGRVPNGVQATLGVARDDLDRCAVVERHVEVDLDTVDDADHRIFGETRADGGREVVRRRAGRDFTRRTIGQLYGDHVAHRTARLPARPAPEG